MDEKTFQELQAEFTRIHREFNRIFIWRDMGQCEDIPLAADEIPVSLRKRPNESA